MYSVVPNWFYNNWTLVRKQKKHDGLQNILNICLSDEINVNTI